MAESAVLKLDDDYYSVLNVPQKVSYAGLQAAYARLAEDLAARMGSDPTAREELIRLNRAFAVLGNSDLRRRYDEEHFADELAAEQAAEKRDERRGRLASNLIFAVLVVVVAVQAAIVGIVERDHLDDMASATINVFRPEDAN